MRLLTGIVLLSAAAIGAATIVNPEWIRPAHAIDPSGDPSHSAVAEDSALATQLQLETQGIDEPIVSPDPLPKPRWQVIDRGPGATALASPDIPVMAISNRTRKPDTAPSATTAGAAEKSRWEIIGQSAGGRPLHIKRMGHGDRITLVIAGLDGDDRIGVKWVDSLSTQLDEAPEFLGDHQLVILRAGNPDGLTAKKHGNDHDVDLNRNFPTPTYRPAGTPSAGPGPASEPETRAIMQLLYSLKPQRIVHVQSSNRSRIAANESAQEVVEALVKSAAAERDAAEFPAGSLEDFATSILKVEMVTLKLATGDNWRAAAIGHFPTLMSASLSRERLGQDVADASDSNDAGRFGFFEATDEPVSAVASAPAIKRGSGYEELPPPPRRQGW